MTADYTNGQFLTVGGKAITITITISTLLALNLNVR